MSNNQNELHFQWIHMMRVVALSLVLLSHPGCTATEFSRSRLIVTTPSNSSNETKLGETKATGAATEVGEVPKRKLIVFIHGVLGDAAQTWGPLGDDAKIDCSGTGRQAWPCLMRNDNHFNHKNFDIFVASYRSSALQYSSNITEVANRLLHEMIDQGFFSKYEQLHFVVHSMGGLIAKRMLIQLHQENEENALKKLYKVRSVIFLGTPAQGSELASIASTVSRNPQFGDMAPADVNTYIQTLDYDWQNLLRRRATDGAKYPAVYCAYEILPTWWFKVVSRAASQSHCDNTPVGFDLNHIDLAKPKSAQEEHYLWVRARIEEASALPGLSNQKVMIMDGSHRCVVYDNQTYNEGATNGDDIADSLRDLPVRTIKEHVHSSWQREAAILAQEPDLLIIHYSAFYRKTTPDDSSRRFQSFIESMEKSNQKIKYLVYTRAGNEVNKPPDQYLEIREKISSDFKAKGAQHRLRWLDLRDGYEFNKVEKEYNQACFTKDETPRRIGEERPSFRDPVTRRKLLDNVRKLLDL